MAGLNLCLVANRVLELLRSEEIRKSGLVGSDECRKMEDVISGLSPLLLDAERRSFDSDQARDLFKKLDGAFCDFQKLPEASKSFGSDEVRDLFRTLDQTLDGFKNLAEALECCKSDFKVRNWVRGFGRRLYHVENCLEAVKMFSGEALKKHRSNMLKKTPEKIIVPASLAYERYSIKEFLNEAERIAKQGHKLNLVRRNEKKIQFPAKVRTEVAKGLSFSNGWASIIDKDKMAIMKILLDKNRAFDILSVVGDPKLGKMILESYVINDISIQSHFDLQVWKDIPVSFEGRLTHSTKLQEVESLKKLKALQRQVEESSHGKRCLIVIVLANMCVTHSQKLDSIARSLRKGPPGSIILVITRSSSLKEKITDMWKEYQLGCLSEEESLDLFKKMVFQQHGEELIPNSQLENIGREVAKSYKENPHVIMEIGSILSCKDYSEEERLTFEENKVIPLIQKFKDHYPIRDPFLKLRYDHLPSPLKHCFGYCSLFPSYFKIDVQNLIKLWIANGFVVLPFETIKDKSHDYQESTQNSNNDDLEEIGYGYFLYLLRRSFFHDIELDGRGRVTKCRIHHPMHNLATWVSENQCYSFPNITKYNRISSPVHVSLVYSSIDQGRFLNEWTYLLRPYTCRSLLILPTQPKRVDHLITFWGRIFSRLQSLRALDIHACAIKIVPYCIGELKHLRYLDLSQNEDITELPDSVTKLLNLQTLKLSSCFKLRKLPTGIGNLVNLRHLEIDGCYSLTGLPRGFGNLTNLRTLSQYSLSSKDAKAHEELKELELLTNLREVHVKNLRHAWGDKNSSFLKAIKRIRSLSLEWESRAPGSGNGIMQLSDDMSCDLEELTLNGLTVTSGLSFLPSSPNNLVKLSLKRVVNCRILEELHQCSKLKVLILDEMIDLEYISSNNFSIEVFPSLRELWMTELPKLKSWWKTNDMILASFPCLSRLVIEDCPNLASFPLFPTLEEGLVLDSTSWELFEKTINQKAIIGVDEASSSSSNLPPLSKLMNLCIVGINNFDDSKASEIPWDTLNSLRLLKFDFLPKTTTLPRDLQRVTGLQELHIWRSGTKEIPEWIDQLKILERLVIRACPEIKQLPTSISSLQKLQRLEIEGCPTLLRRCEKDVGADWAKILHIPIKQFEGISAE